MKELQPIAINTDTKNIDNFLNRSHKMKKKLLLSKLLILILSISVITACRPAEMDKSASTDYNNIETRSTDTVRVMKSDQGIL